MSIQVRTCAGDLESNGHLEALQLQVADVIEVDRVHRALRTHQR